MNPTYLLKRILFILIFSSSLPSFSALGEEPNDGSGFVLVRVPTNAFTGTTDPNHELTTSGVQRSQTTQAGNSNHVDKGNDPQHKILSCHCIKGCLLALASFSPLVQILGIKPKAVKDV